MTQSELLSAMVPNSLRIFTETRAVHLDSITNPEVERTYLKINGSPEAFRWLAELFNEMAASAEAHETGHSVIVDPNDLQKRPITMPEWSALDLGCRHRIAKQSARER